MGKMLVARENFVREIDGKRINVRKGQTRVDEHHPLVAGTPAKWWEEAGETIPVEQATAAPAEQRTTAKRVSKKADE